VKYIIVILDGAAGWPLADHGGKTSLQAASTPHLDALVQGGSIGTARTVPEGTEPSSSAACTSILGYDPIADYVGRGAIEAASMGITLAPNEVALRMNLVTIIDGVMSSYACGHIATEESREIVLDLAEALADEGVRVYPGVAYRHILVVPDRLELMDCSYTPPHDISDQPVERYLPSGPGADFLLHLMARARVVLRANGVNHCRVDGGQYPATDIWPFWPGVAPSGMVPFSEARRVRGAMTSGVDLLNGLAVLTGLDRLDIARVTDGADNDYVAQIEGGLAALDDHDLVVVHVESPDEEGHAGDAAGKIEAIETIDREVMSRVRAYASGADVRVLAMPDHPTPIELKTHVGEPVPFVLFGPGIAANGQDSFDEEAASASRLKLDPGHLVMDRLLG
jgi:2,3-bisphosphoglycerate-independent phosphoglycerate mutase